jgi:hypothetical protein
VSSQSKIRTDRRSGKSKFMVIGRTKVVSWMELWCELQIRKVIEMLERGKVCQTRTYKSFMAEEIPSYRSQNSQKCRRNFYNRTDI